MSYSRRKFIKIGSSLLAGASVLDQGLWASQAAAASKMTSVIYFTPTYIGIIRAARGFVEQFNQAAKNKQTMELYDSGKLLKADEQLPGLRAGNIDLMFHATSYITRSLPILGITGMPGVVDELYHHPERLKIGSPLFNLINEQLARENLYMLSSGGGVLEPEYVWGNKSTPIQSLQDLKGKKMRIASFEATKIMEAHDVTSVRVTSAETYMALQRGTVDTAAANVATVVGRSLYEQLSTCYKLPLTAYTVAPFMLKRTWDGLDDETRSSLQAAAKWYDDNMVEYCNHVVYPQTYWPKVLDAGVKVVEPSAADLDSFNQDTHKVWDYWKTTVGEQVGEQALAMAVGKA